MPKRNLAFVAAAALLSLACDSATRQGTAPIGEGSATGKADHVGSVDQCLERCGVRADHADAGWCLPVDECAAACEQGAPTWTRADALAFDACVEGDPLCFSTLDTCMATHAHTFDACASICDARAEHELDGWCYERTECVAFCESEFATWTTQEREGFEECVENDPLCFVALQQCMDAAAPTAGVDCQSLCVQRDAHAIDGWCFDSTECSTYCEGAAPAWSDTQATSFAECVTNDPLCFRTVDDCVG